MTNRPVFCSCLLLVGTQVCRRKLACCLVFAEEEEDSQWSMTKSRQGIALPPDTMAGGETCLPRYALRRAHTVRFLMRLVAYADISTSTKRFPDALKTMVPEVKVPVVIAILAAALAKADFVDGINVQKGARSYCLACTVHLCISMRCREDTRHSESTGPARQ